MARTRSAKTISFVDAKLLERAEAAAAAEGIGFSEWMCAAAAAKLGERKPVARHPARTRLKGKTHAPTCTCAICTAAKS
jgi:hypothetical protein